MKRLDLLLPEEVVFNPNFDTLAYVNDKLAEAGFDLSKTVYKKLNEETKHITFTQED